MKTWPIPGYQLHTAAGTDWVAGASLWAALGTGGRNCCVVAAGRYMGQHMAEAAAHPFAGGRRAGSVAAGGPALRICTETCGLHSRLNPPQRALGALADETNRQFFRFKHNSVLL